MPASQALEEKLLEATLIDKTYTSPAKVYLGMSTYKPSELTKAITGKEFGEHEPTEGNGWARVELKPEAATWEVTKGNSETGATKWINKNAITLKKLTGGEYKLETFAILENAKQTEAGIILYFGKLKEPVTINASTTEFTIPAKELEITAE